MFRNRLLSGDPATRILIVANVAIFLLQELAWEHGLALQKWFGLTNEGLGAGALWQLVTYQFLHANVLHILMNMLGLWFAGRELERVVGTGRFVALYFIGGVVGGLTQVIFSPYGPPLIGASGSVCAVLLALTTLFPRLPVTALIFFVLPLRMRARTLGMSLVGFSLFFWFINWPAEVGHLAHLGGFAAGWIFGRMYRERLGQSGDPFGPGRGRRRPIPPPLPAAGQFGGPRGLPSVDDILAKVLSYGIESLTREERRILEESRKPRR